MSLLDYLVYNGVCLLSNNDHIISIFSYFILLVYSKIKCDPQLTKDIKFMFKTTAIHFKMQKKKMCLHTTQNATNIDSVSNNFFKARA